MRIVRSLRKSLKALQPHQIGLDKSAAGIQCILSSTLEWKETHEGPTEVWNEVIPCCCCCTHPWIKSVIRINSPIRLSVTCMKLIRCLVHTWQAENTLISLRWCEQISSGTYAKQSSQAAIFSCLCNVSHDSGGIGPRDWLYANESTISTLSKSMYAMFSDFSSATILSGVASVKYILYKMSINCLMFKSLKVMEWKQDGLFILTWSHRSHP